MHRRLWIFAAAAFIAIAAPQASAAPCAPGSFNDYVGLGATGCDIAGTLFSDFTVLPDLPTGATPIDPNLVQLTPVSSASDVGLVFSFAGLAALVGEFFDSLFGFHVAAAGGASLTAAQSALGNPAATGDGVVTLIQDMCLDGTFATPPSGCGGTPATLILQFADGLDFSSDSLTFASGAQLLDVVADFGVDGRIAGSASLESATLRFATASTPAATVPEPATLALVAFALLVLGVLPRARPLPTRR